MLALRRFASIALVSVAPYALAASLLCGCDLVSDEVLRGPTCYDCADPNTWLPAAEVEDDPNALPGMSEIATDASPTVKILAPEEGAVHVQSRPLTLRAEVGGLTGDDTQRASERLLWFSSLDGNFAWGQEISVGGLAVGTHQISAVVWNDSTGWFAQAQVTIEIVRR